MSVRQDSVQIRIDFITDESRAFAKTILATQGFNKEIATSQAKIAQYEKELRRANLAEEDRAKKLAAIAVEQTKIGINQAKIVAAAQETAKIDLSKLTSSQMVERAKQLELAMRHISETHPEFKQLQGELTGINVRLAEIRKTSKGIQDQGGGGDQGGLVGSIVGKVAGVAATIAAVWATLTGLFNFAKSAVAEFDAGAKADAALASRIQSTAGAAGRSIEELKAQAEELATVTLFDDDTTKRGQELLLTFTNIKGQVFDETIPVLQDLSTVMDQDIGSSAVQVGKALNDPIAGLKSLTRVGVTFSEEQKKTIKSLVETGDVAGAQRVILAELNKEFGGAARAAAEAGEGGYQILATRLGEVKESVGQLISRGLKVLQPYLEKVVVFVEGLTEALLSGKEATGEFAAEINTGVEILKFLADVLGAAWKVFQLGVDIVKAVGTAFVQLYKDLQGSAAGTLINYIVSQLLLLRDAIQDLPATWAGVVAAIKQGASNIVGFFESLVLSAQIFRKEILHALAFTDAQREQLGKDLADLRAQKAAAESGKTMGQAYADARNTAIAGTPVDPRAAAEDRQGATARKTFMKPTGGGDPDDEAVKKAQKRRKDLLDNELKGVEAAALRREVVLENYRVKDQINEDRYQDGLTAIKKRKLQEQLAVYRKFKQEETVEALKVQNELLRLEAETTKPTTRSFDPLSGRPLPGSVTSTDKNANVQQRLDQQDVGENALENDLQRKFRAAIVTEQEYNLEKLGLKRLTLDQELEILRSAEQPELDLIRKKEEEKQKVTAEYDKTALENQERLEKMKVAVQQQGLSAAQDVFAVGAELLSQDEKNKGKHASAIKAFQTAQIGTNLVAEVSGIFRNAQESIQAKALGPIAGNILAAVQAAIATVRAGIAVKKIQSAKFAGGGYTGSGYGDPDETGFRIAGFVHEGEHVNPKWQVNHPVFGPVIRWLDAGRLRGYADGGPVLPNVNTTPATSLSSLLSGASGGSADFSQFGTFVSMFGQIVANFPTEVRASVPYTSIEDAGKELNTVRDLASI